MIADKKGRKRRFIALLVLMALLSSNAVPTVAFGSEVSAADNVSVSETNEGEAVISFADTQINMKALSEGRLTLVYSPDIQEKNIVWASSNTKVLTVDETGLIKANAVGSSVVSAKIGENTAECTVNVMFSDVNEDEYYYEPVYWALENGIVSGKTEDAFFPNDSCERAHAVSMLWRANGSPSPEGGMPFEDVYPEDYYYNAVCWAYENEIIHETGKTYDPHKTCTRGEFVTMLWACQRRRPNAEDLFTDVERSYIYNGITWAAETGIVSGVGDGKFDPEGSLTRAHVVTILCNADAGGYYKLDKSKWQIKDYPQAEAVLNEIGWDLKKAFDWSVDIEYYGHGAPDMPDEPSPGIEWFADFGFKNLKGNCYVGAAVFYELAVLLGYNVREMEGYIPLRAGGLGRHGWIEIDMDGDTFVFDPEKGYEKGFKFKYKQPGTWRYTDYRPMQLGPAEQSTNN